MAYDGFNAYDYRAEQWAAENASPLRARRINGEPYDSDTVPDEDDAA